MDPLELLRNLEAEWQHQDEDEAPVTPEDLAGRGFALDND